MYQSVVITKNEKITKDIYYLEIKETYKVKPGQFFMLKKENTQMTLYRPISVFRLTENSVGFLYLIRGTGTKILRELKAGEQLLVHGPYGNGFPKAEGKLALIGGGIGMAPLYLCARENTNSTLYIGLRENLYTDEEVQNIRKLFSDVSLHIKIVGTVIDDVEFEQYDTVFTCGPSIMMKKTAERHHNTYVSLENHMGCGIGACLSCSCKTKQGMKKVCYEGPVFQATEVEWE